MRAQPTRLCWRPCNDRSPPTRPAARTSAAPRPQLYWQAFGGKLGRVLGPDARALAFLERVIREDHVIVALEPTAA